MFLYKYFMYSCNRQGQGYKLTASHKDNGKYFIRQTWTDSACTEALSAVIHAQPSCTGKRTYDAYSTPVETHRKNSKLDKKNYDNFMHCFWPISRVSSHDNCYEPLIKPSCNLGCKSGVNNITFVTISSLLKLETSFPMIISLSWGSCSSSNNRPRNVLLSQRLICRHPYLAFGNPIFVILTKLSWIETTFETNKVK